MDYKNKVDIKIKDLVKNRNPTATKVIINMPLK